MTLTHFSASVASPERVRDGALDGAADVREAGSPAELTAKDVPYVVIVWNDPVNLMSYVSYVFQSYFGYSETKASKLMMEVHEQGKSVVANGSREKAEKDTLAMHSYGLWATYQKEDAN